jgi:hypothetical protein
LGVVKPRVAWRLPENIRFMLPLVAFGDQGIRPEFTLPLARLVIESAGLVGDQQANAQALADLLVSEGIAEGQIEPTPLFQEMYRTLVQGEIAQFSRDQSQSLNSFAKRLLRIDLPTAERYQILMEGVKQTLGFDEVRGYRFSLADGTW